MFSLVLLGVLLGSIFLFHYLFCFSTFSTYDGRCHALSISTESALSTLITYILDKLIVMGIMYDELPDPDDDSLLTRYGAHDECRVCTDVEYTTVRALIASCRRCKCCSKFTLVTGLLSGIDSPVSVIILYYFVKDSTKDRDIVIGLLLAKLATMRLNLCQRIVVRVAVWFMALNAMTYIITFYHCCVHVLHSKDVGYALELARRYHSLYRHFETVLPDPRIFFSLLWTTISPEKQTLLYNLLMDIQSYHPDWARITVCMIPSRTELDMTLKRRFIVFLSNLWKRSIVFSTLLYTSC